MASAPSARGLFRATGKTARPVAAQLLDGSMGKVDVLEREPHEFYPTPAEPTRALLHAELGRLQDFSTIWEPAVGDGAMQREMEAVGLDVFGSDLIDRGCGAVIQSFYEFGPHDRPSRAILTNPPFAECNWRDGRARWLHHALDTLDVDYMALLLSWTWPGAAGLAGFWAKHPPARVYLMRWKIDFTGQGAPPMLNGWFVWDRAHMGETVLRMLDRVDPTQGCFPFDHCHSAADLAQPLDRAEAASPPAASALRKGQGPLSWRSEHGRLVAVSGEVEIGAVFAPVGRETTWRWRLWLNGSIVATEGNAKAEAAARAALTARWRMFLGDARLTGGAP